MPAFVTQEDIANRALQIVGAPHITAFTDFSEEAHETGNAYDKVRVRELRRNVWRFATRRSICRAIDITTLQWTPAAYAAGTTYAVGAVVTYNGDWWQSAIASNVGNTPSADDENWNRYFGPDSFDPFAAPPNTAQGVPAAPVLSAVTTGALGAAKYYVKITYSTATGESLPSIESSLAVLTNQVLSVASPAAATGATGWNVYVSTVQGWETLQSANIAIGTPWQEPTTGLVIGQAVPTTNSIAYHAGELTTYGGNIYLSLVDNNHDTPPTQNWLNVGGTSSRIQVLYPIGSGPRVDSGSLNAFRLPRGFLRRAPNDPKASLYSLVGFPTGPAALDWTFEGNYFTSRDGRPLMLRFVADFIDVPMMDPMFCEGFAAALAVAVAPNLKQKSETAIRDARIAYKETMSEARTVNGVEQGSAATPVDNWIMVRM